MDSSIWIKSHLFGIFARVSCAWLISLHCCFANVLRRVLGVFNRVCNIDVTMLICVFYFGCTQTKVSAMGHLFIKHFHDNNVLIKFYFAWMLTALSLTLSYCRVIDFETKEAYLKLCKLMAHTVVLEFTMTKTIINFLHRRMFKIVFTGNLFVSHASWKNLLKYLLHCCDI